MDGRMDGMPQLMCVPPLMDRLDKTIDICISNQLTYTYTAVLGCLV